MDVHLAGCSLRNRPEIVHARHALSPASLFVCGACCRFYLAGQSIRSMSQLVDVSDRCCRQLGRYDKQMACGLLLETIASFRSHGINEWVGPFWPSKAGAPGYTASAANTWAAAKALDCPGQP